MGSMERLLEMQREQALIESIGSVLSWDQQCVMPGGGAPHRASQMEWLATRLHAMRTDPAFTDLLDRAGEEAGDGDDPLVAANLRQTRFMVERQQRLSPELVQKLARASVEGQHAWEKARREKDYSLFAPVLENIIGLVREKAACLQKTGSLYDALLEEFERGVTQQDLHRLFRPLRTWLPEIVRGIRDSGYDPGPLRGDFDEQAQKKLGEKLAAAFGFNFDNGVLFTSTHPFSATLGPGDYRITTRYDPKDFVSSFLAVAHEAGHSLYEQGLPSRYFGLPGGRATSYGVHESQSLFWEKRVATDREFLQQWHETIHDAFPGDLIPADSTRLYHQVNRVVPDLIRVDADEVTYCLHILIRYEIEESLISGDLKVADIPGIWKEKYRDYLGVTPADDGEGCLQDVHWGATAFGYFPSYALGHIYAASFTRTMAADPECGLPGRLIAGQRAGDILQWLKKKIHSRGSELPGHELMAAVAGGPVTAQPFLEYLDEKYRDIYGGGWEKPPVTGD